MYIVIRTVVKATGMVSSFDGCRHTSSGLLGVDETLEQELDAVNATCFSPETNTEDFSSECESERSDDEDCDDLFEHSLASTLIVSESNVAENSSEGGTEVIDEAVASFLSTTCGCHVGLNEQACSNLFTEAVMFEARSHCVELASDQLDMFILDNLNTHTKDSNRKRCRSKYYFKGHQVCRKTFMFLHGISKKRLQNLKSHLQINGFTSHVHGNTRHASHNRTTHASLKHVVTFIENYAEHEGMSLLGRVPGYKSF